MGLPPRILDIPTLRNNLQRALESKEMKLPDNYLVLDIETSGLSPDTSFIWDVGTRTVLGGVPQVATGEDFYLAHPPEMLKTATFEINRRRANAQGITADRATLNERVRDGQYYLAEQTFVDEVTTAGKDPKQTLQVVADMINLFADNKWWLVGQNVCKFDLPFLSYHFNYYGIKCDMPTERIIDVGILIKAAQLRRTQMAHESCREFYLRMAATRAKGVFFSLAGFCEPYWGLAAKYNLDMSKAHSAGFDCYMTDLVFRELISEIWLSEGVTQ